MFCPNCKKELHCGCNACIKRYGNTGDRLIQNKDNTELESCPYCKHEMIIDDWYDQQFLAKDGSRLKLNGG